MHFKKHLFQILHCTKYSSFKINIHLHVSVYKLALNNNWHRWIVCRKGTSPLITSDRYNDRFPEADRPICCVCGCTHSRCVRVCKLWVTPHTFPCILHTGTYLHPDFTRAPRNAIFCKIPYRKSPNKRRVSIRCRVSSRRRGSRSIVRINAGSYSLFIARQ